MSKELTIDEVIHKYFNKEHQSWFIEEIKKCMQEWASLTPKGDEWISVEDRLPELEEEVQLYWKTDKYEYFKYGYLNEIVQRKSGGDKIVNYPSWVIGEDYNVQSPTHWMKRPTSPPVTIKK